MIRKLQTSGKRGYKTFLPSAFMIRIGAECGDKYDSVMGEKLRYTKHGMIPFPANTYELTHAPYGAGAYLSIPKQWVDHHHLCSRCAIEIEDRNGDIFIRKAEANP